MMKGTLSLVLLSLLGLSLARQPTNLRLARQTSAVSSQNDANGATSLATANAGNN